MGHRPRGRERAPATASRVAARARRAPGWPAKAVKGVHEAYRADVRNPIHLERVAMVSNLHPWVKRHPWRFTGMNMKYVRSYLSWRVHLFRVKQANER